MILSFDHEISQAYNENATARLWIQPNGLVYKQYVIWNKTTLRNVLSLLLVGCCRRLRSVPQIVMPDRIVFHGLVPVGFLMKYCRGQTLWPFLEDNSVARLAKRDCFRNLAVVIECLPKHIFIGDLHGCNVMVSEDGSVQIIDVDGFSFIGNEISCPMALVSEAEMRFTAGKYWHRATKYRISRDSDILCFFMIFLQWLMGGVDPFIYTTGELLRYVDYLERVGFPAEIVRMMRRLFEDEPNFIDPEPFSRIDTDELDRYSYHAFCVSRRE